MPAIVGVGRLRGKIPALMLAQEQSAAATELPEATMQQIDAVRGATAQIRDKEGLK